MGCKTSSGDSMVRGEEFGLQIGLRLRLEAARL